MSYLQHLFQDAAIVGRDGVEQLVDELGRFEHVDHQVGHAAERPRPLEERKRDAHVAEPVGMGGGEAGQGLEAARIVRIGKGVAGQGPGFELVVFHDADVFVDGAIPDHAELVAPMAGADFLPGPAPQGAILRHVVAENRVQVGRAVIRFGLLPGRRGEGEIPRHPVGLLVPNRLQNSFAGSRHERKTSG